HDPRRGTGAMLVVRRGEERSMVADRGANAALDVRDLPEALPADVVLVSGYVLFDPGSERAGLEALARARAPIVAVDAASWPLLHAYGPRRFLEATRRANVLLANERELDVLASDDRPQDIAARWGFEHLVLKRGPRGATAIGSHQSTAVSAPTVTMAD